MIQNTRGIVLHFIKYSETSVIATIYTEKFGRQSFLIKGVRGKKSNIKANILQPLFLLDMEVYYKPMRDLQSVKEVRNAFVFSTVPYDLRKSSIALFIAEILYKTIREQEANSELFEYLYHTIQMLDLKEEGISTFHLYFLLQLTKYLGFYPTNNYTETESYFDLKNGSFVSSKPMHPYYINPILSEYFSKILPYSENQHSEIKFNYQQREVILDKIVDYYCLHNEGLKSVKSLAVLKEVFH
ncbi:MAG: DNA repair protein RecO [Bacteroidetes bacterium GWF2_33_16]|nr:MAG: DNA repair protein RecO [Bacteroidetes bacterium GWE2_32_14]OFY07623.1 MAG: DNA repair protein RecO [Bacteroidetes bacterium GWF2_33_16]